MAIASMTGFARGEGQAESCAWTWEVRSVNGRGLEVRCRLPLGFEGLEPAVRQQIAGRLRRGSVAANLLLSWSSGRQGVRINTDALDQVIKLIPQLRDRLPECEAPQIDGLLGLRGIIEQEDVTPTGEVRAALETAVLVGLDDVLSDLVIARQSEGARAGSGAVGPSRSRHGVDAPGRRIGGGAAGGDLPAAEGAGRRACSKPFRRCPPNGWRRRRRCWRSRRIRARNSTASRAHVRRRRASCWRKGDARSGRKLRFPVPGVQPRGQHPVLEVDGRRADPPRPRAEGRDRSVARASAEHRIGWKGRRRSSALQIRPSRPDAGARPRPRAPARPRSRAPCWPAIPQLSMSVSVTTRAPRPGEVEGEDYHFVSVAATSSAWSHEGELLEHAKVFDNCYGTPRGPVEARARGRPRRAVRHRLAGHAAADVQRPATTWSRVFILPPSHGGTGAAPARRGRRTATRSCAAAWRRAADEMSHWAEYDYVIVNRAIEKAPSQVPAILTAERLRAARQTGTASTSSAGDARA